MRVLDSESSITTHGTAYLRTPIITALALIAFAANSIICRMALGEGSIDPASFTTVRIISGAVALFFIVRITRKDDSQKHPGSWISGAMLFLYAVPFSFAYVSLSTGIGALILFGSVQATMILVGLLKGERPHILEWCGLLIALSGLVYLVLPGLEAPSLLGALLMTTAGVSWGIYSLRGFNVTNPAAVTGDNFLRAVPPVIVISLLMVTKLNLSLNGIFLAFLSGALTSGIGYVLWYAALQVLSATRAATVQLLVPIIAALGGILILSEPITLRLVFSGIMIIGGVGTTLAFRNK